MQAEVAPVHTDRSKVAGRVLHTIQPEGVASQLGLFDVAQDFMRSCGCRVWKCLTQEPVSPENLDELLKFLFSLMCQAGTRECLIAEEDITSILDDCFPSLDPKLLSLQGYACLKLFILKVSESSSSGCTGGRCSGIVCRCDEVLNPFHCISEGDDSMSHARCLYCWYNLLWANCMLL